jgi:diguanylate cyclase (GGDEF)-like protein
MTETSKPEEPETKDFAAAIAQLRQSYIDSLPVEFAKIDDALRKIMNNSGAVDAVEVLRQRFHKLAGSSGTFGLTQLGGEAKAAEEFIKTWQDKNFKKIDNTSIDSLSLFYHQIKAATKITEPSTTLESNLTEHNDKRDFKNSLWLIEDDELLGKELKRQFNTFGFKTETFTDIQSADEKAKSTTPGAVLIDVMFENKKINATEEIIKSEALSKLSCPLMFMSAYDDFDSRVRAVQSNAKGYFLKPVIVPKVVNHLQRLIDYKNTPKSRILIVDDDEALAQHFKIILQDSGFEVRHLLNPREIISTISDFIPEVVLMDLEMPEYNGIELAGVIRQHEKWMSLPIIYLSAETDVKRQAEALEKGAEEFLTKPISDAQLIAVLRARVIRTRQLDEQISRDGLTGLLKHAVIKDSVNQSIEFSQRNNKPCCIVMLDLDHFKSVNDRYGHAVGDLVISSIALALQQRLRKTDLIGRYGGEEFVAVLNECDAPKAFEIMDEIRSSFSEIEFSHENSSFNCSFSAGIVCSNDFPKIAGEQMLIAADMFLYQSKQNGRNQITCGSAEQLEKL